MDKKAMGPHPYMFPMPAVLLGANVQGKPNYLAAAYAGVACHEPPHVVIGLRSSSLRYTRVGIEENNTFSLNIPSRQQMLALDYCGIFSGRKKDKTKVFTSFYGKLGNAPMIEECPVNLECRLAKVVPLGSHDAFFGEVAESYADPDCLEDGSPGIQKVDPLIFEYGRRGYWSLGEWLGPSHQIGRNWRPR
jgi:flavin reductase (DIM6/NTAB) family NADH-FMN oxidoreductase RutF